MARIGRGCIRRLGVLSAAFRIGPKMVSGSDGDGTLRAHPDLRPLRCKPSSSRTREGRTEFDAIARRLRSEWKAWQGEDSLYEMAFGEAAE